MRGKSLSSDTWGNFLVSEYFQWTNSDPIQIHIVNQVFAISYFYKILVRKPIFFLKTVSDLLIYICLKRYFKMDRLNVGHVSISSKTDFNVIVLDLKILIQLLLPPLYKIQIFQFEAKSLKKPLIILLIL